MLEQLIVWVGKAMVVAWLSVGTLVGITPKDVRDAIAVASLEKPLFEGVDGARRTAALITAVGVFEGGYNNQAKGDCKNRPPGWPGCGKTADTQPTSFCFGQIHFADGVEKVKGYTPEELLANPLSCARAMREILRDSIKISPKDPLRSYAGTSGPAAKRWDLARKLFREVTWDYRCDD
jgi:hypothetical protein